MPRSKTKSYQIDSVVPGAVFGIYTVTSTSPSRETVGIKCNLCGTEQEGVRAAYLFHREREARGKVVVGCYRCWRSNKPRPSISPEEALAKKQMYWRNARGKLRKKMLDDPAVADRERERSKEEYSRIPWKYKRLNALRSRALRKGLPWEKSALDGVEIPETCPALGIPLKLSLTHGARNSPSVDRIVPELGYVKGNLQILSNMANGMKQEATPEQLRTFAKWVLKVYGESDAQLAS